MSGDDRSLLLGALIGLVLGFPLAWVLTLSFPP